MTLKICSNTRKLSIILSLTIGYFFAELIVGTWIKAISLVADSFHMLSDVVSIIIAIVAIRVSKLPKSGLNTFGWQRAELFGTLVNCISLIALNFTILVSAIQRFLETENVTDPLIMLFVGTGGLFINLIGLLLLSATHSHKIKEVENPKLPNYIKSTDSDGEDTLIPTESQFSEIEKQDNSLTDLPIPGQERVPTINEDNSMNMSAVFLHVFADFIGSVIVCISALLLLYGPGDIKSTSGLYKLYVDPSLSIIMVFIIILPTISLVKQASLVLLQSVPQEINVKHLSSDLRQIKNVISIHDLHIWKLRPRVTIGTVHVKVRSIDDFNLTTLTIKKLFHDYNIHCTTIQPEFTESSEDNEIDDKCELTCDPSNSCSPNICCPQDEQKK